MKNTTTSTFANLDKFTTLKQDKLQKTVGGDSRSQTIDIIGKILFGRK